MGSTSLLARGERGWPRGGAWVPKTTGRGHKIWGRKICLVLASSAPEPICNRDGEYEPASKRSRGKVGGGLQGGGPLLSRKGE